MFAPQLAKYYVIIQLAEKHFVSQETFRRKIRCKILCYHLSFPSLSLFLADLTTQISSGWEAIHQSGPPHDDDGDDDDDDDDDADDGDDDE